MSRRKSDPPSSAADDNEKVGYARPPAAHRFKPGQSGNPAGRAKGARNLKTDLAEELAQTILVQEAGVAATLTKQQALVKRLCAQALAGDARAISQLVQLILRLFPEPEDSEQDAPLSEADIAIIQRALLRASPGR